MVANPPTASNNVRASLNVDGHRTNFMKNDAKKKKSRNLKPQAAGGIQILPSHLAVVHDQAHLRKDYCSIKEKQS